MVETNKRNKVATSKKSILFLIENTVKNKFKYYLLLVARFII